MTDTTQQEREAFEACMKSKGWKPERMHRSVVNGGYAWVRLNEAWEIWQAARATPQGKEPVAEGKTVPENATGLLQECASALARTGGMMNKDLAKVVTKFLSDLER